MGGSAQDFCRPLWQRARRKLPQQYILLLPHSCSTVPPTTMAPTLLHLPNGQIITVSPVFAGFSFKANDLIIHHSFFPPGWHIILETTHDDDESDESNVPKHHQHTHRFRAPTLRNDHLFISTISNPSSMDFKPPTSPTRQIAMMLWVTLWWYFHQVVLPLRISRKLLIPPTRRPQIPVSSHQPVQKLQRKASQKASGGSTSNEKGSLREGTCYPN